MNTHPVIDLDEGLLDDVSTRMDLRTPNAEAVRAVAERFATAGGEPFEVVCDLATAVGKTYLAAGLIEYLAASDVRNVLIVTPGRTILEKTVGNFTDGHPKSVTANMERSPLVITAENFNTGAVASALSDENELKLFVFNVQQLISPTVKATRRTRKHQEWLGADLYAYLQGCEDLVVIADEAHVYAEKAKAFSNAVRDLGAMATVGLTATPAASDEDKIIYHYPLARAIADRYVKTPVLVGRRDDATDVRTRLRDGLTLLEAKQKAADTYANATGADRVNAVMFVVADTIDNANAVAEVLCQPGMLAGSYDESVLVVHSNAPDDALARLAKVEEPDSAVRVIVSVSMLKEGWDVKNIFVIASLRPSISDVLTEQTLGRGLRLPWGAYTGVELLDTVEVLSHERYAELLEKSGVLLEGLVEVRGETEPDEPAGTSGEQPGDTESNPAASNEGSGVPGSGTANGGTGGDASSQTGRDALPTEGGADEPSSGGLPAPGVPTVRPADGADGRVAEAEAEAAAATEVCPSRPIAIPEVTAVVKPRSFSLSDVSEEPFVELGKRLASAGVGQLDRKLLEVQPDPSAPAGYRLVPRDASEAIEASAAQLPLGGAKNALAQALLSLDVVAETKANLTAAKRLAARVIEGAGDEALLASYLQACCDAAARLVRAGYSSVPDDIELQVGAGEFAPVRINTRPVEQNRFGPFSRKDAYSGWQRAQHPLNWFDSRPERTLANLLDSEDKVKVWSRVERGELTVRWDNGRYSPDFYAEIEGKHYLLEVKADKDMDTETVSKKAAAAQRWARRVSDEGDYGEWRYLLVSETVTNTAKSVDAVLKQAKVATRL